ncbi:peptidoglycan bridge formation glycyltransferase FemA/FemB family protein [Candidatus Microgenomates bacterium]|nr:peptidoglycan bridge formation glycyltransferase FemA/FemB family protein [Candidatus Microgenomates bacterium]
MDKFTVKQIKNKKVWETFVLSKKPQTFLQSWNWGEVNENLGEEIIRLGFYKNNVLVGICLLIKQNAKRGPHFLIPAGPLMDWEDENLAKFFKKSVYDLAKKSKVWFVRIRPEILDNKKKNNPLRGKELFRKLGMKQAPMHLHAENTWILDISKSEDELLSEMRKTTRYLIRKSLKYDLTIEVSKDPKLSETLFNLQKETALRHKFVGFSEKLFKSEIKVFSIDKQAEVFLVKKAKEALAIAIIIFYGDSAYYHFSGSTSKYREIPFSYRLQWEIIKHAKRRGIKFYNFWGIAPNDNPKHRFAGVTLFKTGFGGERIDWFPAHDLVINPLYYFTYIFETLRKTMRRL